MFVREIVKILSNKIIVSLFDVVISYHLNWFRGSEVNDRTKLFIIILFILKLET